MPADPVQPRCPECGSHLTVAPSNPPPQAVCGRCGAIAWLDPDRRVYRMPKTTEWMAILHAYNYAELCDRHLAVLDALTATPPAPPAQPPVGRPGPTRVRA